MILKTKVLVYTYTVKVYVCKTQNLKNVITDTVKVYTSM